MSKDSGFILTVYSNAVEGKDAEYEEWYVGTHFGEVLTIPGFVGAQLHKVAGKAPEGTTYLAIYELEGDPKPALTELESRMRSGAMAAPVAGDVQSMKRALYSRASARASAATS
jgi:hypothetical protein